MPKVTDAHREARRAQIVDAAITCFAEKGFQRTSMADIIEASGLSAGAIYLQFESKQDIAIATAQAIGGRRMSEVPPRLETPPAPQPDEFVDLLMIGLMREIHDSRILVQLWAESLYAPEMGDLVQEVFGRLRPVIARYLAAWARENRALSPADAEA